MNKISKFFLITVFLVFFENCLCSEQKEKEEIEKNNFIKCINRFGGHISPKTFGEFNIYSCDEMENGKIKKRYTMPNNRSNKFWILFYDENEQYQKGKDEKIKISQQAFNDIISSIEKNTGAKTTNLD